MEELAQKMQEVRDRAVSPMEEHEIYESFRQACNQHQPLCSETEREDCMLCGFVCCPFNDPLHFHHDGCPSCWTQENIEKVHQAFAEIEVERKLQDMSLVAHGPDGESGEH